MSHKILALTQITVTSALVSFRTGLCVMKSGLKLLQRYHACSEMNIVILKCTTFLSFDLFYFINC